MENKVTLSLTYTVGVNKTYKHNIQFAPVVADAQRDAETFLEVFIQRGFWVAPNKEVILYKNVLYVELK